MTPFTQQTIDTHVRVYTDNIAEDMRRARTTTSPLRRAVARGLVRFGAWLLPDKPDMVGDTVIVLRHPRPDTTEQAAA